MPGKKLTSAAGTEYVSSRKISPAHHSFVYKIGILRRVLDRYSGPAFTQKSGLTLAEWRVLTNLYSFSPTTSRALCLRLHTDKAEVSRACAALIASGYAKRRPDPHDRRSALIVITPRGERLHDQIIPLRQALQRELETPLTAAEIADLHRILDKLLAFFAGKIAAGPVPAVRHKPARRPRGVPPSKPDSLTIQRPRQ
jgi:DNA-binding MarR family transcriptional regulator